jgi:GNAT superfamily N-acetyltransferase
MEPRIRLATVADASAVAEVNVLGWRWAYRGLLPEPLLASLSVENTKAVWSPILVTEGSTTRVWLAERHGHPCAVCATGPPLADAGSNTAELYAIYQREETAGTGVGRALLDHVASDLRARGFTSVIAWVIRANARACRAYARAGWAPDGAEKHDLLDCVLLHEVRYRRRL